MSSIHEVYPYLRVKNADAAIRFYEKAFGAVEDFRMSEASGRVGHAELKFGNAVIMLSDEYPEYGILAPGGQGVCGVSIHLHVGDVDSMTQQAVDAGATLVMEPKNQFYGERTSKVVDPFFHEWILGSQVENVSRDEMKQRFLDMTTETNN